MSTGYPEQPDVPQQPSPEQAPAPEPTFEQGLDEITQHQQPGPQPSVRQAFADRGYDVSQFQDDSTQRLIILHLTDLAKQHQPAFDRPWLAVCAR